MMANLEEPMILYKTLRDTMIENDAPELLDVGNSKLPKRYVDSLMSDVGLYPSNWRWLALAQSQNRGIPW